MDESKKEYDRVTKKIEQMRKRIDKEKDKHPTEWITDILLYIFILMLFVIVVWKAG